MDQENLNLTVSCSPHVHAPDGTRDIMLDVLIGLIPAMLGAVFFFGLRSLCVAAVSVAACIVFEFLYRKLLKKDTTIGDCSAIVTGLLLAYGMPGDHALLDDHHRRLLRHCGGQAAVRRHRLATS